MPQSGWQVAMWQRHYRILHIFAYAKTASSAICCSICWCPFSPSLTECLFPTTLSSYLPPLYIEMHFVALPLEKANFTKISIINCSLAKCKNASKEQAKRGAWSRERGKGVGYIAIKIRLAAMQILFIKLDGEGQFHKTLAMPTAIMPANRQSGRGPSTAPTPAPLCQ